MDPSKPAVGDVKIVFKYFSEGPASVLGVVEGSGFADGDIALTLCLGLVVIGLGRVGSNLLLGLSFMALGAAAFGIPFSDLPQR